MTRASRGALAPLAHPAFWIALAALALNDHVLKGARVLPGVVTGKLSDFAGLIVAPVLVAVWLPRSLRWTAFVAVAAPFALIKMSPSAAALLEQAVALAGIRWRIWADPTDLVALTSLPVAWWICDATVRELRFSRVVERAGIVLGAAACIATGAPPGWTTSAYLVDWSTAPQDVRIRWIDGELDCTRVGADAVSALGREEFMASGITFSLAPNATVPLDRDQARRAAGLSTAGGPVRDCDAALLEVEGMPDTIVFWQSRPVRTVATTVARARAPEAGAVALVDDAGPLGMLESVAGAGVAVSLGAVRVGPDPTCAAGTPQTFAWSTLPSGVAQPLHLETVSVGIDGCVAAVTKDADGLAQRLDVCVPADLFPFVVGDDLTVHADAARLEVESAHARLLALAGIADAPVELGYGARIDDLGCGGERDACGAYAQPTALFLAGATVLPGDRAALPPDSLGRPGVVAVGRAERVLIANDACEAPRSALGLAADLAMTWTEVTR